MLVSWWEKARGWRGLGVTMRTPSGRQVICFADRTVIFFQSLPPSPSPPLFYFQIGWRLWGGKKDEKCWCFYCEVGGKYFAETTKTEGGWLRVSFYFQPRLPLVSDCKAFDGGVSTLYYVLYAVRLQGWGAQAQHN